MWDERYAETGFAYGKKPNEFLAQVAANVPIGRALCLASGEGRNAVFLAELGFDVTAVDQSTVGLAKTDALARERGVEIETVAGDLGDFALGDGSFELITSIFAHTPSNVRKRIHEQVFAALTLGGTFVLEAYTPEQVGRGTGGPPDASLTMTKDALAGELSALTIEHLEELQRPVVEGRYHTGVASVVQLIARKTRLS